MGSKDAILKTLLYSDIFDYPLSKDQLWKFLIGKKIDKKSFKKALEQLKRESKVFFDGNFYCLPNRKNIIATCLKRKNESINKINIAKKIIKIFTFIPTIQFVGISGALALQNCDKNEDIDLFVITSGRTLWTTRFIMIILLKAIGRHRNYNSKEVSDKICLNMLIDEEALELPKEKQNLYTVHEVIQLMPILDKRDTYDKFLSANVWVRKFLPNAIEGIMNQACPERSRRELRIKNEKKLFTIHYSLFILEWLAKQFQLWFINKHKTTEIVSDKLLAFHPFDYKNKILSSYKERLKKYELI